MSGLRNTAKTHSKWILGIVFYLLLTFLLDITLKKKKNYNALYDWQSKAEVRLHILESYHK